MHLCIPNRTGSKVSGARNQRRPSSDAAAKNIATFGKWCQPLADHALYVASVVGGRRPSGCGSLFTEACIDNPLGLRNNFLCSTFLEIGRAISQCAGRASRIDRCPPALADRAYLNSISLIVDRCHCCDVASARKRLDRPRVREWEATQDGRMPAEVKRRQKHHHRSRMSVGDVPTNKSKDPSLGAASPGSCTHLYRTGAWGLWELEAPGIC